MITQKQLKELVEKWDLNLKPSFRRPTCADCGTTLWFRMWHVFLKSYGYKREIHLCKRCGHKYGIN